MKCSIECKYYRIRSSIHICQFSVKYFVVIDNCEIIVQVQPEEYQYLTSDLKYCRCETHTYTVNKGTSIKEDMWQEQKNDANKLQSGTISKINALWRTYAVSGSCRKWHVAVRMSAYTVHGEKPIRVESFGIRKVFWSPVKEVRNYCYVSACRNDVITCGNKEHTSHSATGSRELSHFTLDAVKSV